MPPQSSGLFSERRRELMGMGGVGKKTEAGLKVALFENPHVSFRKMGKGKAKAKEEAKEEAKEPGNVTLRFIYKLKLQMADQNVTEADYIRLSQILDKEIALAVREVKEFTLFNSADVTDMSCLKKAGWCGFVRLDPTAVSS